MSKIAGKQDKKYSSKHVLIAEVIEKLRFYTNAFGLETWENWLNLVQLNNEPRRIQDMLEKLEITHKLNSKTRMRDAIHIILDS